MDNLILSPFIWILKILFQLSTSLSSNLGLSIILLSLLIYLITFPLIKLVEKLSSKEEAKKTRVKHLIEEINSAYKGQTRFFYTKTLYKIHGINPLSDLFGIGKLLVQIPFFLAAYHYLSSLEVFNGVSFLFISDLSKMDQAIPFAGIKLNILPVLMFIINTISAWIFAKENKNEFFTLFITGALFLFLLYPMPAALVLYWTCNNIISLIVETYKSRSWIKDKVNDLNLKANIKYFLNRNDHTFMFLCLLLHTSIASYCLDTNYLLVTPYYSIIFISALGFVTYLYLELTGKIKSYEEVSILNKKQSIFLLLGSFTPLFMYAKENYVFIQDGLIINFFASLIIPSFILYLLLNFFLLMVGKKERIFTYIISLLVFFNAPIFNDLLKLQAENALPYSLGLFLLIYLISLKFTPKTFKFISYFFLLAFSLSSLDFLSVHHKRDSKNKHLMSKIEKNQRTNKIYREVLPKLKNQEIPNVYFLIYDGLTGKEVMQHYGLNYELSYLEEFGFKIYGDIISNHNTSIKSIASTLELSKRSPIKKASDQRKNMVGYNLVDKIFESLEKKRTYLASNHFFKGQVYKDGSQVVSLGKENFNGLLSGVIIGEFKFDIEIKDQFSNLDYEGIKHKLLKENQGIIYVHNPYPGHSQNSGKCQKDDISLYQKSLNKTYPRMKEDIRLIQENDPNGIIVVAGDHGAFLSGDCKGLKTTNFNGATLPIFAETHGTFLAIKWPNQDFKEYTKITSLQSLFVSIFAYIAKDPDILKFNPKGKICLGEFCTDQEGKTSNQKDIFKELKNYQLIQF